MSAFFFCFTAALSVLSVTVCFVRVEWVISFLYYCLLLLAYGCMSTCLTASVLH